MSTPTTYKQKYYLQNKTKLNDSKQCDVCGGKYSMNTRINHYNTKKHKMAQMIIDHNNVVKELEIKLTTVENEQNENNKIDKIDEKLKIILDKINGLP